MFVISHIVIINIFQSTKNVCFVVKAQITPTTTTKTKLVYFGFKNHFSDSVCLISIGNGTRIWFRENSKDVQKITIFDCRCSVDERYQH